MIVTLDKAWKTELLFLPARNGGGQLVGLELIANFVGVDDAVRTPTTLVTSRLSDEQEVMLFREKLALLETCQIFFIQQQLIAWINITPAIALALLTQKVLAEEAGRFSFLEFTVNENFPELNATDKNHLLVQLANLFPLALANFGAGDASTQAVFSGLFKRVTLDKNFIQQQALLLSFDPFMRAIIAQVQPCCTAIMAAGVDNLQILERLEPWGLSAYQGLLWPAVDSASLTRLMQQ
ncbi:EAL domain-containing protein [Scandinavium goeteborgense]|jgi:EAL domain-containing protein (putative c-di-GMP-specific phosphodiesterase class I)|uniref:EAL domain-containing protein n=1 Tax=Scandinavium goeteborgense TaxID=1851514 RepID=UPI000D7D19BE|nr:EAL domain-containing protein [Scandinavium goeteborgense]MCS2154499.1 EAL domain-containing protein [Scandinavium goeteborgense]